MTTTLCRVCDRALWREVLDLGKAPLANAFRQDMNDPTDLHPLELGVCSCGAVQLLEGVDPALLFGGDYAYHSSVNRPYVEQCHRLVDQLVARLALGPDDLVAEIGSNDGYLLCRYLDHGVGVMGIEPAPNLVAIARERGVTTMEGFFGEGAGAGLQGRARIVHANNVLAHAPDVMGILRGVAQALAPDGVLVVETPYVAPMIDGCLFDTIYHEHIFYWSATAFGRACRRAGLAVVDVERLASHGGSLRLYVTHQGNHWHAGPNVTDLYAEEHRRGIHAPEFYADLQHRVDHRIRYARDLLLDMHTQGLRIHGYGAAAKGTMLLHALALPAGVIDRVYDATDDKIGRYMPGSDTLVVHPDELDGYGPDVVLVLAWNWADAIMAQHPGFRGRWLSPMPMLRDIRTTTPDERPLT